MIENRPNENNLPQSLLLYYHYEQKNTSKFFNMKLVHTRTNQLSYLERYSGNYQSQVYEFGVFYDTCIISYRKLQYNYQWKDSFSLHLMSLITDNSLDVNHIIALLNYHNCLYYNHTKFGLNHFASYKTLYHEKQNMSILNRIYDILVSDYNFNCSINIAFKLELDFAFKLELDRVFTSFLHNKIYKIIDFANQDLINMVYEIAQQNKKIKKKLAFMMIYNLFLR